MLFLPTERVALFIDGANLYSASRNLGFDVDYRNLLAYFRKQAHVIRAYYYSALLDTEDYSPLKPLTDWLAYNGYSLVTKPAREFTDSAGRRRIKGNMDIEVAVDMLELAPRIDHAVLFSGDSDFRRLVEAVQRKGVRVSVVSSIRTTPPMVADELRRQADQFLELAEIAGISPAGRPSRGRHGRAARRGRPPADPFQPTRHGVIGPDRDCPLCPRLVAYRAANRTAFPELAQRAGSRLRTDGRAAGHCGPCAGAEGREPHRSAIHRRLCRRVALRDAVPLRADEGNLLSVSG